MHVLVPLLFLAPSCKQVDKFTQFELEYRTTAIIPSSSAVNLPFNVFTPDIESNSATNYELNDTRKDRIEQVILQQAELEITSPENGDFGFLKALRVFLSAEGEEEKLVAFKENIPEDIGKKLILETSGENVKQIMGKETFQMRLETVTDELLTRDHEVNVYAKFFVDAELLGQ